MKCRGGIFHLLLLLLIGNHALAQSVTAKEGSCNDRRTTVQTELHFRWDRSELDTAYMGNGEALARLSEQITAIGTAHIDSVVIRSQSSPEGTTRYNERLSIRRAATMRRWMEQHHAPLTDRLAIYPEGESWGQLRTLIAADTLLDSRTVERLLQILDDPATSIDTKRWRITHHRAYRYLYRTYYPRIRNSMVCVVYFRREVEPVAQRPIDLTYKAPLHTAQLTKIIPPPQRRDTLTVALKTNLLYDLVTALNFEVEIPIGDHYSIAVEDLFPWWERDNKYCFQLWEMGIEGRYWLRANRYHSRKLQGYFAALYARSAKYDFQWDRKGCYQGEYWSAGLTVGYAMRLAKRFNLEFALSVGYLSTAYRHYQPDPDYDALWRNPDRQGRVGYFGPTQLKVSLVVPLHLGYEKGGRR